MSKPVSFLGDENFDSDIFRGIERAIPTIQYQTASAAGILSWPDPEVLRFASREGMVLVSHDMKTMPKYFDEMLAGGEHSAGLIMLSQSLPLRNAMDALILIWSASSAEEWIDKREYWR